MKKLNLTPYEVKDADGNLIEKVIPKNLAEVVLMHPQRQLNGSGIYHAGKVAGKILMEKGDIVLLEDVEIEELKNALEQVKGQSKGHYEFVCRVLDAEDVKVGEVKKGEVKEKK